MTYHIHARSVSNSKFFYEQRNVAFFLRLFERHLSPFVTTLAYCLLPHQVHILMKLDRDDVALNPVAGFDISKKFSNFFNAYAKTINKNYSRRGSLFMHPFLRSPILTDEAVTATAIRIHRLPLVVEGTGYDTYPHSSYSAILNGQPSIISLESALRMFGDKNRFAAQHQSRSFDTSLPRRPV
jgi:hypothetical protein